MTDLSPAAQAVMDAFSNEPTFNTDGSLNVSGAIAAALRAVVARTRLYQGRDCLGDDWWMCDADELLGIAAELEDQ